MGKLYRMDARGHGTVAEWSPDNKTAIAAGKAAFAELQGKGMKMFRMAPEGEQAKPMDRFDETADEILAVPQLQAG